jgi:hypothetical protein
MLADITFTITTEVIHAAAWFVIGSASSLIALYALNKRAETRNTDLDAVNNFNHFSN